jgi:hypothetical protein
MSAQLAPVGACTLLALLALLPPLRGRAVERGPHRRHRHRLEGGDLHATVVTTDTATNVAVTVITSDHGDYVVTPLNPGVYRVAVTSTGSRRSSTRSKSRSDSRSAWTWS